jgi:hypothetical protein
VSRALRGKSLRRSVILWIMAVVLTLGSAVWQRLTGPTHPVRVRETLAGGEVRGRLPRSADTGKELILRLTAVEPGIEGRVVWRLYPGDHPWREIPLVREGDVLAAGIPTQPPAGKLEYQVELTTAGGERLLIPPDRAAVARFKGHVTPWVLGPHILLMFLGMLWSTRAGLEALAGGAGLRRQALVTLALLAVGGLILGPVVQKQAFGAFWTGWPLGEDLTDNKLAAAVLVWAVAAWRTRRGGGRGWALLATAVTLAVYAIPHSLHGSTLDYQTMETISG